MILCKKEVNEHCSPGFGQGFLKPGSFSATTSIADAFRSVRTGNASMTFS